MRKLTGLALAAGVSAACVNGVQAAVLYTTAGSVYTQNFDSLPQTPTNVSLGNTSAGAGWTDDNAAPASNQVSIVGWYLYHPTDQSAGEGGVNGHQRFRNSTGNSSTGTYYSFGVTGVNAVSDRALGDVGANTLAVNGGFMYYGLRLSNNTGQTLTSFDLSFDGEQWRTSGLTTTGADPINFDYSTDATATNWNNSVAGATFTSVPGLTFNAPQQGSTSAAAIDGNASANRVTLSATGLTLNWAPGTDLWLRWSSLQNNTTDHGMAIDNVSFTATPEPASLGLLTIGAAGLLRRRRAR